ncbi:MAG: CDP-alcohol phosphatidyltransferase family protein [Ignavibacteriaceae bacterium]
MNYREIYTKSNIISLFRLFLAIPLWFLLDEFNSPHIRYVTFAVCLIASFSDILDGYLARKYNEVTETGKIIDPLADKIAVGAIIIKLYLLGQIPAYYFLIIILRDIVIFLGGIFVAKKIGRILPSNVLGKITVINIGIVILLIILQINGNNLVYKLLYASSIALIFASLVGYIIRAKEFLKRKSYGSI